MKILITLASLDIGGAETHVAELASELHKRGHNVIVASDGGVYADWLESQGIKHYKVPLARRSIPDMLKSRKLLKKIIRAEKPHIVHAHARIPAFIVGTLKKACNFVFVTTVHGAFDTSFILRHLSGWGDKTLAVSEDLKTYLMENYSVSEENIYTSINGISAEKFNPNIDGSKIIKEFNLSDSNNKVCYVSRLSEGVCSLAYTLIDETETICNKIPDFELIIVGDGELYEDLKEKADAVNKKLGRGAITLTGARTDVNEIIAVSKVCVGVSRAILEPMAMEKLCIVAGDPGYIGIFHKEKLDTAVACNFTCRGCGEVDKDKLTEDVITLLTMENHKADELKAFAGETVRTMYSIDKMVSDNEKMYFDAVRELGYDVGILGYYGYDNCGDDALLHAILKDILSLRPYLSPTVLSYKPAKTQAVYGVRAINRFNIFKVKKLFKKIRLFIAGGGSLIQDITSTKSLFYYLFVIRLAKKMGLPVMLYGNGIGPVTKGFNRKLASKVLNMADLITLRDKDSKELLAELGVTNPKIQVTADPALGLSNEKNELGREILRKYSLSDRDKFFCVSVRKWKNMGDSVSAFAKICEKAYREYGLIPVFVPMQYAKDISISKEIASLADCPSVIIDKSLTAEEIMSVMSLAECALAVRLHMLIFGVLVGIPVMGVNYDPKVSSFLSFAGLHHCISTEELNDGEYMKKALDFFETRVEIGKELSEKLPGFKNSARENAKLAVELMENER